MISRMISRYAIYGDLYLCRASYQAKGELQACLVQLYAAMLGYLSHAQKNAISRGATNASSRVLSSLKTRLKCS